MNLKKKILFIILLLSPYLAAKENFKTQSYEMILFSYDHSLLTGWSPHTFATFYPIDSNHQITTSTTISWLPETSPSDVSIFGGAVKGKNYTLQETLQYALKNNKKLIAMGPFQISKSLYELAKKQADQLTSGNIQYRVTFVNRSKDNPAYHCVYAISDLLKDEPPMSNGLSYTTDSMNKIISYFSPHIYKKGKWTEKKLIDLDIARYNSRIEHD